MGVPRELAFLEEKSAELLRTSSVGQALPETIQAPGCKPVEAEARGGIRQAEVSKLVAGQIAGVSVERLVHFLSLLGQDV
ncbi:MAG: hypothetical protein C4293_19405 [Nitrospiraceae bacterium]